MVLLRVIEWRGQFVATVTFDVDDVVAVKLSPNKHDALEYTDEVTAQVIEFLDTWGSDN
jgi:hypothetical protein